MDSFKSSELSDLLLAIRGGKDADLAFLELESRYKSLMYSRVRRYFGAEGDLSEPLQEARIAIHNAALTYEAEQFDGVTFGLYAGVCVSNRLCSLLRKNAKLNEKACLLPDSDKIVAVGGPESFVARKDLCERVMRIAKAELSDFEFQVFRMEIDQYTTADIAKALGKTAKSIDNAKNRIHRLRDNKEICDILFDI